jgi:hypothetical protein
MTSCAAPDSVCLRERTCCIAGSPRITRRSTRRADAPRTALKQEPGAGLIVEKLMDELVSPVHNINHEDLHFHIVKP